MTSEWKSPLLSFAPYKDKKLIISYGENQTFEDEFGHEYLFYDWNSNVNQGLISMAREIKPEVIDSVTFNKQHLNRRILIISFLKWLVLSILVWSLIQTWFWRN